MTDHQIHPDLPNGFAFADELQEAQYAEKGVVHGARKVCFVADDYDARGYVLAVVLAPPRSARAITRRPLMRLAIKEAGIEEQNVLSWYIEEYNRGYRAGKRGSSEAFATGYTSHAYDDGYLDAVAQRPKWHLTHCVDHDRCGEA